MEQKICFSSVVQIGRNLVLSVAYKARENTVKRLDEVVRHPHLVTQDQFTQVSKKVSDIPAENFTINIELFRQTFTNVELLRHSWKVSKAALPGREPRLSGLQSDTLPLRHTSICLSLKF